MHILNTFFDEIFVISIERNAERLKKFLEHFKGINVQIFKGIDGKELFPDIEYVYYFPRSFFDDNDLDYERCVRWNKGQLGCAMSNLLVQKEIIKRGLKNALILEDDAFLLRNHHTSFEKAINELPASWELFYLGYNDSLYGRGLLIRSLLKLKYKIKPVSVHNKSSSARGKMFLSKSFSKHLNKAGVYFGTHAYALSNKGARKLVNLDSPLQHGFDTTLYHACYHKIIEAYALKEKFIIPHPGFKTSLT